MEQTVLNEGVPLTRVDRSELPSEFSTNPSAADVASFCAQHNMSVDDFVHEVVFAVPDCTVGRAYRDWWHMQPAASGAQSYVRPVLWPMDEFRALHGDQGVVDFFLQMGLHGCPVQPVRLLSDRSTPPGAPVLQAIYAAETASGTTQQAVLRNLIRAKQQARRRQ